MNCETELLEHLSFVFKTAEYRKACSQRAAPRSSLRDPAGHWYSVFTSRTDPREGDSWDTGFGVRLRGGACQPTSLIFSEEYIVGLGLPGLSTQGTARDLHVGYASGTRLLSHLATATRGRQTV